MTIPLHHIVTSILLLFSFVMPLTSGAACLRELADTHKGVHAYVATHVTDVTDGGCPCDDCCENNCGCSGYAPLTQSLTLTYSPTLSYLQVFSISMKPPQVYFSIFVPPQNLSLIF